MRLLSCALLAATALGCVQCGGTQMTRQAAAVPQQARPGFSIVSVKPSPDSEADDWGMGMRGRNFWATHVTANELIEWAYSINAQQLEHAPDWLAVERFDVEGVPDSGSETTRETYRAMLQSALADRFGLRFHNGTKVLPVYVLSIADGGLKIPAVADTATRPAFGVHAGWFSVQGMTFESIAHTMQRTIFNRPVLDRTGLSGRYSFVLKWRADDTQFTQMQGVELPKEPGTDDADDIETAARQTLGLRIQAEKAPTPTLSIDHITRPTPN